MTAALVRERPEGELRQTEEKWEEALPSEEQISAQVSAIFVKGLRVTGSRCVPLDMTVARSEPVPPTVP